MKKRIKIEGGADSPGGLGWLAIIGSDGRWWKNGRRVWHGLGVPLPEAYRKPPVLNETIYEFLELQTTTF